MTQWQYIGVLAVIIIGLYIWNYFSGKKKKQERRIGLTEACPQLQSAGINISLLQGDNIFLDKLGKKLNNVDPWVQLACDVRNSNIDYIFNQVIDASRHHEDNLIFAVIGNLIDTTDMKPNKKRLLARKRKWTYMSVKKNKDPLGMKWKINWKGDDTLIQQLRADSKLNALFNEHFQSSTTMKSMQIYHNEPYDGYAIINISFFIPSANEFEILDIIAGHVKEAWFGS